MQGDVFRHGSTRALALSCATSLATLASLSSAVMPAQAGTRTTCTVRLAIVEPVVVETLAFEVTYRSTKFDFGSVTSSCRAATPSLAVDVADTRLSAQQRRLSVSALALGTVQGPADIVACEVGIGGALPVDGDDYTVNVVAAADAEGTATDPLPSVAITQLQCAVTTTTSTTTTTRPAASSTTTLVPERCTFDVALADAVVLGRIDVAIDYADAGGAPSADPVCSGFPPPGTAYVVDRDERRLTLAAVAAAGFQGPRTLARCGFVPTHFRPVPEDFALEVIEAYDPAGTALMPAPVVEVLALYCPSDPTTTTTTTTSTTTSTSTTSTSTTSTTSSTTTSTTSSTSTTTLPAQACGDANADGAVSATDALIVLRASIDLETCAAGRCDVDGNGTISATDALVVLNFSVGRDVELRCQG